MARGRRGQDIFLSDTNRTEFLELFGELCGRKNWACYAYCLMNNHYHLVLDTSDANLSSGIRLLNGTYARRFNRGHGRQGRLFQGRLLVNSVENASYLREFDQGIASLIDFVREGQGARSIRSDLRARSVLLRRMSRKKGREPTATS